MECQAELLEKITYGIFKSVMHANIQEGNNDEKI